MGISITKNRVAHRVMADAGEPARDRAPAKMWAPRTVAAVIVGGIFIVGGFGGLVVVSSYWGGAACPSGVSPYYCPNNPAPLSSANVTSIIVGSVVSLGFVFIGIVIVFVAAYFPILRDVPTVLPAPSELKGKGWD